MSLIRKNDKSRFKPKSHIISSSALVSFVALGVAGCANTTPAPGGDDGPKRVPVVIVNEEGFANCPVYSPTQSLTVFNAQSWRDHARGAVLRPNGIRNWKPNFATSTVLRFAVGQKPTLGYGIRSGSSIQTIRGELRIPVVLTTPAAGAIVGQAITDPCLYMQVTGVGYTAISIVDAKNGSVLKKLAR